MVMGGDDQRVEQLAAQARPCQWSRIVKATSARRLPMYRAYRPTATGVVEPSQVTSTAQAKRSW
jgi:hypothetical protein